MSITRIQSMSQSMNKGVATISTTGFTNTPTQGNTLIMYLGSQTSLGVTSVRSENRGTGGQNWGLCTSLNWANAFLQVWINYNVPVSIGKTITLNTGVSTNFYYSFIEEVSGITTVISTTTGGSIYDSINVANYGSGVGANWSTIASSFTQFPYEYWVNVYGYWNPLNGDPNLSPQFPYVYAPNMPITFNGAGTTTWSGSGLPGVPAINAGLFVASTVANNIGINSGIVTDSGTQSNWLAASLTFYGLPRKTVTHSWISN